MKKLYRIAFAVLVSPLSVFVFPLLGGVGVIKKHIILLLFVFPLLGGVGVIKKYIILLLFVFPLLGGVGVGFAQIIIEDGCNVQENCIIHMFPGTTVVLKEAAHIGHGAIIHGANIGKNVLVGMNAVLMDDVEVGDNCIIGTLTFVPGKMKIPARKIVVGNPAKIIKDVSEDMIEWKTEGTKLYQQLPADLYATLKECEPLREIEKNRPKQQEIYKTWKRN